MLVSPMRRKSLIWLVCIAGHIVYGPHWQRVVSQLHREARASGFRSLRGWLDGTGRL